MRHWHLVGTDKKVTAETPAFRTYETADLMGSIWGRPKGRKNYVVQCDSDRCQFKLALSLRERLKLWLPLWLQRCC